MAEEQRQQLNLSEQTQNANLVNLINQFGPVLYRAAEEAGQTGYADKGNISNVIGGLVQGYANKYQQLTGNLPSIEEINSFVGSTVTDMPTAYQLITNKLPSAVVAEKYAAPHIQAIKAEKEGDATVNQYLKESLGGAEQQYQREQSLIDQLTQEAQRGTRAAAEEAYGQELRRQAAENAQMGRLSQPVYQENVNRQSQAFGGGLAKAIAGIQGQALQSKAQASQSLAERLQRAREFGVSSGLQSRGLNIQEKGINLNQRNLEGQSIMDRITDRQNRELAANVGRMQAEANEPGTLDYVNTAFGGVSALLGGAGAGIGLYDRFRKPKTTPTTPTKE